MGPRSTDRGNEFFRQHAENLAPLQWGRDRLIAEMNCGSGGGCGRCSASMGPRSTDRGNEPGDGTEEMRMSASMGPRSTDRGNGELNAMDIKGLGASMGPRSTDRGNPLAPQDALLGFIGLQWGRDRLIAEIGRARIIPATAWVLQWGR